MSENRAGVAFALAAGAALFDEESCRRSGVKMLQLRAKLVDVWNKVKEKPSALGVRPRAPSLDTDPPEPKLARAGAEGERVSFEDVDGVTLRGLLLLPDRTPAPVLVMTHGFTLTWRQGLLPIARACREKGIAVLMYDHRGLGESDGDPRGGVDVWAQLRGYRRALAFLARRAADVDPRRVALFGYSLSGSEVLTLGALLEARVAVDRLAIVAVSPGPIRAPARASARERFEELAEEFDARVMQCDPSARARARRPAAMSSPLPVVRAQRPLAQGERERTWFGGPIGGGEDARLFFQRRGGPRSAWLNTALIAEEGFPDWDCAVRRVTAPTLLLAARDDATTPFASSLRLFEALSASRCALHIIERGGHFGVFDTPMTDDDEPALYPEEVVAATGAIADFLASVLFD